MKTRTLTEIIQDTATTYQAQFVPFLIIAAPLGVLTLLFNLLAEGLGATGALEEGLQDVEDVAQAWAVLAPFVGGAVVGGTVAAVLAGLAQMALLAGGLTAARGELTDFAGAWGAALSRIVPLILAGILAGLALMGMVITVIGIPFAIYFGVRWSFVPQAVLEGAGPREALSRSSDLVKGQWWRVVGISIVLGMLASVASGIANALLGLVPLVGLAAAAMITAPLQPLAESLLYYDLKARHEGTGAAPIGTNPSEPPAVTLPEPPAASPSDGPAPSPAS